MGTVSRIAHAGNWKAAQAKTAIASGAGETANGKLNIDWRVRPFAAGKWKHAPEEIDIGHLFGCGSCNS